MTSPRAATTTLALAILLAACSDDDAGGATPPPTPVATTVAPAVDTTSPATVPPSTPPAPSTTPPSPPAPTTEPPPATTTAEQLEEAVKAEVAAAYVEIDRRTFDLVHEPSLRRLHARVARIAVRGGIFDQLVRRTKELVRLGDRVVLGDPPVRAVTVESVELTDPPPYRSAVVTSCDATNAVQVTPRGGPDGEDVLTGDGLLRAFRTVNELVLTDNGWRLKGNRFEALGGPWEGVTECPPA